VSTETIHVIEETEESSPRVEQALRLIEENFERPDRQGLAELRSEIAEKRLGLLSSYDFHMFVAAEGGGTVEDADEVVIGTIVGAYLEGVNCGFITYLAVAEQARGRGTAQKLRTALVEAFRANARNAGYDDLDYVLGEVLSDSAWLQRLLDAGAEAFRIRYYHPGMAPGSAQPEYTLYREPIGGRRGPIEPALARRMIYSIYRRAYRVRYPLERPGFRAMIEELGAKG
jgi:ribosomal protein S18 acetylase RimI-like enzyme